MGRRQSRLGLRWTISALTASVLLLSACGSSDDSAEASDNNRIRLASTNSAATMTIWIGIEQGIFKKNGVDVEFNEIATPDVGKTPSVLGKQYDIALGVQPVLISAANQGIDVVQVAGNEVISSQKPTVLMMARPEAGIKTLKDLEGKRVASATVNGNMHIATWYWLGKAGVDTSKIEVVETSFSNMSAQLKSAKVDAVEVNEPYTSQLKAQGFQSLGNPLTAIEDPTRLSFWIANGKWARENQETVKKFRTSLDEVEQWIVANDQKARDLLVERTKLPMDVIKDMTIAGHNSATDSKPLETWMEAMKLVSGFDGKVDASKLVIP